jgi:hypothetical protein
MHDADLNILFLILVPMLCIGMQIGGSASGPKVAAEPRWRVFRQSLDTRKINKLISDQ